MALPVVLESTATVTGQNNQPFHISSELVFIANDSDTYDMLINFNKSIEESGAFTLKAGELLDRIPMSCHSISYRGISGSVPFRAMGV